MGKAFKWPKPFRDKRPKWCPPTVWEEFRNHNLAAGLEKEDGEARAEAVRRFHRQVGFTGTLEQASAFDLLVIRRWPVGFVAELFRVTAGELAARARAFVRNTSKAFPALIRKRLAEFDSHPTTSGAFPVCEN